VSRKPIKKNSLRGPRKSIFADKQVRIIIFICLILVALYLATVTSIVVLGYLGNDTPRTLQEQELTLAQTEYEKGEAGPENIKDYAVALAKTGQGRRAHQILDAGDKANIEDPERQWLLLGRAQVYLIQSNYKNALQQVDKLQKALAAQYKKDIEQQKGTGNPTYLTAEGGRGDNYFTALTVKAEAYEGLKDYKNALKAINEYLSFNPTAADMLEWRGDILFKTGDNTGALESYKEAKKYNPGVSELEKKISKLSTQGQNGK